MRRIFFTYILLPFLPRNCAKAKAIRCEFPEWHDYCDDLEMPAPAHFYTYHCSRCGKEFTI